MSLNILELIFFGISQEEVHVLEAAIGEVNVLSAHILLPFLCRQPFVPAARIDD